MPVLRLNQFRAKVEHIDALREFLISILPLLQSSEGCISCRLLQSQEDPAAFMIIEVWDSVEAHQASVANIPAEKLSDIRPLIAAPPSGQYFDSIAERS